MDRVVEPVHPSELIADELEKRGWCRLDLARRMGGNDPVAVNLLALDLYCEIGPTEPDMRLGQVAAGRIAAGFETSPEYWLNLEAAWLRALARLKERDDG